MKSMIFPYHQIIIPTTSTNPQGETKYKEEVRASLLLMMMMMFVSTRCHRLVCPHLENGHRSSLQISIGFASPAV
jgi:hypothetical protein